MKKTTNKSFKRIFAFILAFTFVFASFPLTSIINNVMAAEVTADSFDGTFEGGTVGAAPDGWVVKSAKDSGKDYYNATYHENYSLLVTDSEKNGGNKAMALTPAKLMPGYVFAESDYIEVSSSTAYSFEYAMKFVMNSLPSDPTYFYGVKVYVRQYDQNKNFIEGTHVQYGSTLNEATGWENYCSYLETKPNAKYLQVLFFVGARKNYRDFAVYIDDIDFSKVPTDKLLNGDIEIGTGENYVYSWHLTSKSLQNELVADDYTVNHSLTRIKNGNNGYSLFLEKIGKSGYVSVDSNYIKATKNASYALDFTFKVTDALNNFQGVKTFVAEYDANFNLVKNTALHGSIKGNRDWTENTYSFSLDEKSAYFRIEFWCGATKNEQFKAYFDNVKLTTVLRQEAGSGINNGGFEMVHEGTVMDWKITKNGVFNVSSTPDGYNGTKGLKLIRSGQTANGNAVIQSNEFKVAAGREYKLNYMARYGNQEGSVYIVAYAIFYDANGKKIETLRDKRNDHYAKTDEWVGAKSYFTAPENAVTCIVQILVRGTNVECWLDDVIWTERDTASDIYGMDTVDKNGKIVGWSVTQPAFVKVDNSVYREGTGSLFFSGTVNQDHIEIVCDELIPVNRDTRYKLTAYIKSYDCSINTNSVRLYAICYDENKEYVGKVQGLRNLLSEDSVPSSWREMICGVTTGANIAYIRIYVDIAPGTVNAWIDDVSLVVYDQNNEYWEDFDSVDNNGLPAGWELESEDGNTEVKANDSVVTVTNTSSGTESILFTKWNTAQEYTTFTFNTSYSLTGGDAEIRIRYFDFKDMEIESDLFVKELDETSGEFEDITFELLFPSAKYAIIEIYLGGKAEISLKGISIVKSEVKETTSDTTWRGKWVWHYEDYKDSINGTPRYFRYHINIPDTPAASTLQITADDRLELWINGNRVEDDNMNENSEYVSVISGIEKYLKTGDNVIAVSVRNFTSYAGLLFDGYVETENGEWIDFYSNESVLSTLTEYENWNLPEFEEKGWTNAQIVETVGGAQWGDRDFDNTPFVTRVFYIDEYTVTENCDAGDTITLNMTLTPEQDFVTGVELNGYLWIRNSQQRVLSTTLKQISGPDMSTWKAGEQVTVSFSLEVPDFVGSGRYVIQLDISQVRITNDEIMNNRLVKATVVTNDLSKNKSETEFVDVGGTKAIKINGDIYPNISYGPPSENFYTKSKSAMYLHEAGICITRAMTRLDRMGWIGYDTYDFDTIDAYIYDLLSDHNDTYLLIMLKFDAPDWWKEANPDELVKDNNGDTSYGVSMASEKFVKDVEEAQAAIVNHMKEQPYWNRVIGGLLCGYKTSEFLWYGNGQISTDYSPAAETAFRKWLTETYKTDAELQKAWKDNSVTLNNAKVPSFDDQIGDKYESIKNPETQLYVLDYMRFKGEIIAERAIEYARFSTELFGEGYIIGAYYGYAMNRSFQYSITNSMHTHIDSVLDDENIDFFATPVLYDERYDGEISGSMAMLNSVLAHGKAVMLEDDLRLCTFKNLSQNFYTRDQVGPTYNVSDSVSQLERSFVYQITNNIGNWYLNLTNNFIDLKQFSELIEIFQNEQYVNFSRDKLCEGDVCFILDEANPEYTAFDTNASNEFQYDLLAESRNQFAKIGVPVDSYYMSDVEEGLISDEHKVYIMFSPIEISDERRAAIDKYLKKDGNVIVWIYLSGVSDRQTISGENMSKVVGMDVVLDNTVRALSATVTDGDHWLTEGLKGQFFGNSTGIKAVSPTPVITDKSASILAYLNDDKTKGALAVKEFEDWTSIVCSVPFITTEMIRNILEKVDAHIYSENKNDVIFANSNYVGINCAFGGEKTIKLGGNYAVYEVFSRTTYSLSTDTITFNMADNSTKLFRLTPVNKHVVFVNLNSKGQSENAGWNEVNPDDDFACSVTAKEGYHISAVIIDGVTTHLVQNSYNISLDDVENSHFINVVFAKGTVEDPVDLTIFIIAGGLVLLAVGAFFVVFFLKKRKAAAQENK